MCGIAGVAAEFVHERFAQAVERMVEALSHRGPDSHGVENLRGCILGNTRLAIVDPSPRGSQPMSNEDSTLWITYNGECYNAGELREQLASRAHRFRSTTDTEVVLRLYQEIGDACVEKMRGMFAFAIWDTRKRRLFLARDRMGIKPLYYTFVSGGLLFASEIKALLASGLIAHKLDPNGIQAFLELGHIPPPWTAIREIRPLRPGHIAVWQDGTFSSRQFWSLPSVVNGRRAKTGDIANELGETLLQAGRLQLMSDVPVALFLSGGVDSAVLGVLACQSGAEKVTAVTVGFEEEGFDESDVSRQTADILGIPHRVLFLSANRVASSLDHVIWAMDQPTVDGLNTYWIARVTSEAGFKVALSGQGGDELFGGYESIKWFERFEHAAELLRFFPRRAGESLFDYDYLRFRWRKLSYLFGADDPFVAAQLAVRVLFPESSVRQILGPADSASCRGSQAAAHLAEWATHTSGRALRERIAFQDFHAHLEPRLLRDSDAMSMAHSLELRPIFLDHEIVNAVWKLPASLRLQKKRLLLAAAERHMPDGLLQMLASRPKRTFTFPLSRWLSTELKHALDETFQPEKLRGAEVLDPAAVSMLWRRYQRNPAAVGWSRIWSLFVLQRWCEIMKAKF
jgi:asparagine synthase (glutamine-hydrolysing)